MTEFGVEYGLPPENKDDQKKVQKLFEKTWAELESNSNKKQIYESVKKLMNELDNLGVELPCQGVEYQGVIINRDVEISDVETPAPFIEWAKALGVTSDLFEKEK